MRRRNAEAEQGSGLVDQPAQELLLEEGGVARLEDRALLLDRLRLQDLARIDPIEPSEEMDEADQIAEQPAAIKARRETRDPAAAADVAALPIAPRRRVEMRAQMALVQSDILRAVGIGEEGAEAGIIGQMQRRRLFEPVERDMRWIEVHRSDSRGIGREIGEDVAAARGDRHDMTVGRNLQHLHVDHRIFPDLGIDQPAKGESEGAFEQALLAQMFVTMHRTADGAVLRRLDESSHGRTPDARRPDCRAVSRPASPGM